MKTPMHPIGEFALRVGQGATVETADQRNVKARLRLRSTSRVNYALCHRAW